MSSNQSVLDVLAQEGIPMTEEQLIGATQKMQSNGNGAAPAQTKGRVEMSHGPGQLAATGHTKPVSGPPRWNPEQPSAAEVGLAVCEVPLVTPSGRQGTPKPWLMAVLCRLGMHGGWWAFVVEGNCTQGRECGRCGSVHVRTKHRLEWRYKHKWTSELSERNCEQVRTCRRCDIVPTNVVHLVGGVDVPGHTRNVEVPVGQRTHHDDWGEWRPVAPNSYIESRHCARCGKKETRDTTPGDD